MISNEQFNRITSVLPFLKSAEPQMLREFQ
jgi:hypothetical protein